MKILKIIGLIILLLAILVLAIRFLSGPEDAWLCQNNQWIKHGQPDAPPPTASCGQRQAPPAAKEIVVAKPLANQPVSSPLLVEGRARGNWFFEAVFPLELVDSQGRVLGQSQARAQSDWTSENFIPFKAEINYQVTATTSGRLILRNDNPSGLPEREKRFVIPLLISPNLKEGR